MRTTNLSTHLSKWLRGSPGTPAAHRGDPTTDATRGQDSSLHLSMFTLCCHEVGSFESASERRAAATSVRAVDPAPAVITAPAVVATSAATDAAPAAAEESAKIDWSKLLE
eukprot:1188919-Prorocentrum_minimum.AAC.2